MFGLNVNANMCLIRSMDALLRASDAGRAIFVTSRAARRIKAYWAPYAASKAALDALAKSYAAELEKTAVKVTCSIPESCARACAPRPCPAKTRRRKPARGVAEAFVPLAEAACTINGEIVEAQAAAV